MNYKIKDMNRRLDSQKEDVEEAQGVYDLANGIVEGLQLIAKGCDDYAEIAHTPSYSTISSGFRRIANALGFLQKTASKTLNKESNRYKELVEETRKMVNEQEDKSQ